jgi:hypothetical protein
VRHVGTAVGARYHTEQLVDGSEGGRLLRRGDFAAVEAVLAEDPVVELPAQVRQPAASEDVLPGRLSPGGDNVDRRIHRAGHAKEAHMRWSSVAGGGGYRASFGLGARRPQQDAITCEIDALHDAGASQRILSGVRAACSIS